MSTNLPRFFTILLLFVSSLAIAFTGDQYLYVEIRGLSANRGLPELKKELQSITAIRSMEYCENAGLLIIESSCPADSIRSNVNHLLHDLKYKYVIKSSIPIEEAHRICNRKSN